MLKIYERISSGIPASTLTLPYEMRIKARFRAILDDGAEVGLFLDRGPIMRNGDLLLAEDRCVIKVLAANEKISRVTTADSFLLARACYHLGNRHVPLQILPGELRYQCDHVLDDMMRGLGLNPTIDNLPFEPEAGAYGEHGSEHSHGHSHAH